jgi:hypothetical protein
VLIYGCARLHPILAPRVGLDLPSCPPNPRGGRGRCLLALHFGCFATFSERSLNMKPFVLGACVGFIVATVVWFAVFVVLFLM